ncbi:eukaryotic translation initiation factor 5A-2 [Mycena capillaripes]|nr:eukaryotic translation initiation factor 5A-2 [Mycena capillaripes]
MPRSDYIVDEHAPSYEEARAVAVGTGKPTFSVCAARLRAHHIVVIKGRPVRVVDLSVSAAGYGKKIHIVALDIFTGKRMEAIMWLNHFLDAPVLKRAEYTLVNIDAPILNLLTDDGESKDDVNVPQSPLGKRLAADFTEGKDLRVTTLTALEEEQVESYKEAVD